MRIGERVPGRMLLSDFPGRCLVSNVSGEPRPSDGATRTGASQSRRCEVWSGQIAGA